LGRHRLLCGNALELHAFEILMQGAQADVVFIDPPYNVRVDGHASGLGATHHREFAMASGEMSAAQYTSFLALVLTALARHSADGAILFSCMDWRHLSELLTAGRMSNLRLKNICVWVKHNAGMGSFYRSQYENIVVFKAGRGQHRNNIELGRHGRHRSNVWSYPAANNFGRATDEGHLLGLHPTPKPVRLVGDAILDCSARGELVLDSFLGSGTTLIAAERTGRRCYGMEIDPLYVDTAIRRWQAYTGDHAVHAISGKRFDEIAAARETGHD
jgi:DNA modification methylase